MLKQKMKKPSTESIRQKGMGYRAKDKVSAAVAE